ncbi:response regulator transcription factor [Rhodoferax sp. AJA081-3]|uniref:response regulator transcription factor n=1 Tax=Rhodoferax sp. AJA081-3 TaxID=2752316 RepID=UPI001ADEF6C0|nr:response regulator [Rhodoferax sp. AJA081-3]QTN26693.1 response regulator transcription factor [Rhodoferax sp. AJA081-3]
MTTTQPTIYLCDDDEGVRTSLAFLLRQHDLEVTSYASGPELLAAIDAATVPLRGIFVLDVRMEPLSGLQVHEALISRGLDKRMPVLFLSGHGDIPMAVGAMARGAFSFAEKPYADEALVQLIRQALNAEVQWHGRMARVDALRQLIEGLSRQQVRLMPLVAAGELNKTIAWKMELSVRTVEEHRRKIFERLNVHSAAELATLLAEARTAGIDIAATP